MGRAVDDRGKPNRDYLRGTGRRSRFCSLIASQLPGRIRCRGRETGTRLVWVNGEPVLHKDGITGGKQYNDRGQRTEKTTWTGWEANPNAGRLRYLKWEYDIHGNSTQESYYGAQGEPVLYKRSFRLSNRLRRPWE